MPSIFYYRSELKNKFNCISFSNILTLYFDIIHVFILNLLIKIDTDQYQRTRSQRKYNSSSKQRSCDKENQQNLEISNRFQTHTAARSRSKFKNNNEQLNNSGDLKLSDSNKKEDLIKKNSNSSMSSLSSTLSNFMNKKKRLTKSNSCNFELENEQLLEDSNIIKADIRENSTESVCTFSNEDFNFDYKCRHENRENYSDDSNRRHFYIDEKILRHPALIKQNFKSKSVEQLTDPNNNNNNILFKPVNKEIKPKYKKNNSNQLNNELDLNSERMKTSTINSYKLKKLSTQKSISSRPNVYAKRRSSPPPPISLSPNGLLAPPPLPPPSNNLSINLTPKIYYHRKTNSLASSAITSANNSAPSKLYPQSKNSNNQDENVESQNYNNLFLKKNSKYLYNFDENGVVSKKQNGDLSRFKINAYNNNAEKLF
jgi:hypothetical protein